MSENLATEMWSRVDLNCRPPLRLFIEKLSADLATDFLKIKAAVLERASSPRIRLECFSPKVAAKGVILAIFPSIFSILAIAW